MPQPDTGVTIGQAIQELYRAIQRNARWRDAKFYRNVREPLDRVCAEIAKQVDADSCAVFFVDRAGKHGERLVARGASGRLREAFNDGDSGCVEGGAQGQGAPAKGESLDEADRISGKDPRPGLVYWPVQYGPDDKPQDVTLTQAVWHCGLARWANTRAEMERLRRNPEGGRGDPYAYPGGTLDKVFRNCVIVPIFAPGRVNVPPSPDDIGAVLTKLGGEGVRPKEAQQHWRFLRNHSVVGVLKVENKRPQIRGDSLVRDGRLGELICSGLPILGDRCPGDVDGAYSCAARGSKDCRCRRSQITRLSQTDPDGLAWDLLTQMQPGLGNALPMPTTVAWGDRWDEVCREVVDHCTRSFDATFTNEGVELLVALAMQLGRILPWRTIQYGCANDIVIDENEVGSLLIQREDISDLAALGRASAYIAQHVAAAMEQLRSDLSYEDHIAIAESRELGLPELQRPLGEAQYRVKAFPSLLRKAIVRHDRVWERHLSASPARGTRLFTSRPLVRRLLGPRRSMCYNIRDPAGCRVTCDYLSDIYRAVRAVCSRQEALGIKIREMREMLDAPDPGGYRAVHLDLLVKTDGLVPEKDLQLLRRRLRPVAALWVDGSLALPCELQLRTAYEDSWARKSHDLVYKLDRNVARLPRTLIDSLEILSSNLHEADRLSDIVREQIHAFLAPDSTDILHLLGLLGKGLRTIPESRTVQDLPAKPSDWPFAYILLAMECAPRLYEHVVRYDGQSHFSHAVSIALQLVKRFDIFPEEGADGSIPVENPEVEARHATLIALALLHDCWLAATDGNGVIRGPQRELFWEREPVLESFYGLLHDTCGDILRRYHGSIDCSHLLGDRPPKWVELMLDEYRRFWRHELGDTIQGTDTAKWFWDEVDRTHASMDDDDLVDVCRLRAAMLIDRLEELPDTPNQERRRRRFRQAYDEFRRIRMRLAGIPGYSAVTGECYRVMQNVATRLGVEIPIHWYEE